MTRKMKDSGIEWIGEIPEDWEVVKNKHVFNRVKEIINNKWEKTQLLSLTTKGIIEKDINNLEGKLPESFSTYQVVKKGDLILCLFDLDISAVFNGLSSYYGMISPAYKRYVLKISGDIRYYNYLFDFIFTDRKYKNYSTTLRFTLDNQEFDGIPTIKPNTKEQIKISDFLDRKRKQIEKIKSTILQEIQTLEDYKKSVITEAVTKGLDKNVEMKDSGIEWIGEIPKHWNTIKAKILFNIKDGTHDTPKYVEKDMNKDTKPLITTRNIKKNIIDFESANHISYEDFKSIYKRSDVEKYDLIMPMIGTIGSPVIVDTDKKFAIKNVALLKMNKDKYFSKYIYYQFHSEYVEQQMRVNTKGGVQFFVSMEVISRLYMLTIKRNEIVEIVNYLNKKTKLIDESIEAKQKQLEVLEEYKKSLIYEYVTGKKEVE